MFCELEVLPGLKPFALDELDAHHHKMATVLPDDEPDSMRFRYRGSLHDLLGLRMAVAAYVVIVYDIPRPKALLGHQHLHRLLDAITQVQSLHPAGAFRTFRFSAAGRESAVFGRLRDEIAAATGLINVPDDADLLLRVRPSTFEAEAWDVLVRLSPRPLATRAWRACDLPGALNATIAAAMVEMMRPRADDRFLNLMCGSGTLLVERLTWLAAQRAVGCDIDGTALDCARQNVAAAGLAGNVELFHMDATRLAFEEGAFDAICADLPWGQLVGSHTANETLYPRVLEEAARVAAPAARLAIITHEVKLFEGLIAGHAHLWTLEDIVKLFQGGLHPRIYMFRRTGEEE